MKHYYTIVLTFIATLTFAQNNKHNIRGLIVDKIGIIRKVVTDYHEMIPTLNNELSN